MKIGIVGSRRKNELIHLQRTDTKLREFAHKSDTIVSGLCSRGGDRFAVILARKYGLKTEWYPANWEKYGKRAGLLRNTDIARESDILIAVVADDRTGGTEDTIRKFKLLHPDRPLHLIF